MPDRLQNALDAVLRLQSPEVREIGSLAFLLVLTTSLVAGIVVAGLYRHFYGREQTGSEMHRAFPLLAITITAIFICIQFSLPLSLGLLGALSIVRFRTPVKEPQEIGFLMVVIASSLACATFNFTFLVMILGVVVVGLLALDRLPGTFAGGRGGGLVMLSVPAADFSRQRDAIFGLLSQAAPKGRLESLSEDSDEVVLTYSFRALQPTAAAKLQDRLRETASPSRIAISYDRGTPL
jgi:hypothetical protein